ncbi:sulfite exporter TauE/SafE family protein [Roseovarius sp.]|uniref:sulfite exporter TauE/SafE family protein n=1 Tax=Roseovarius sp. TaxID=1486281 RepID=UPI0025F8D199|nr:sulfite exporter TauE/SafE family protein [Roseovarius sp.]
MEIYLPIAEVSVNGPLLLSIGLVVGLLSGMFGVGGGFLITPLLFFIGIPPAVAVATSANQIVASSFSAILAHIRRRTVDFPMGIALMVGGLTGSTVGIYIFNSLRELGQVDLLVNIFYVVVLGVIGALMFIESLNAMRKAKLQGPSPKRKRGGLDWVHAMPLRIRFRSSGLYISVFPPLIVGFFVGVLSAIMGVGGGFVVVPAMIYILGMPTKVVVGTSLFQIIFVSGYTTMMHAYNSHTVDTVLAVLLIVGGVIGAQLGARVGLLLKAEQLRILLALLVLAVCLKLGLDLVLHPAEPFSISVPRHL